MVLTYVNTKTKIIWHVHAGRRADFFCGVYQLETRFARIRLLKQLTPKPGWNRANIIAQWEMVGFSVWWKNDQHACRPLEIYQQTQNKAVSSQICLSSFLTRRPWPFRASEWWRLEVANRDSNLIYYLVRYYLVPGRIRIYLQYYYSSEASF